MRHPKTKKQTNYEKETYNNSTRTSSNSHNFDICYISGTGGSKGNNHFVYEYARNNEKVELPKKEVTIKEIELFNILLSTFVF